MKGMLKQEINAALKDGTLTPEDLNDPDTAQSKLAFRALKSLGSAAGLDDTTQLKARQAAAGMKSNMDQQEPMSEADLKEQEQVLKAQMKDEINAALKDGTL